MVKYHREILSGPVSKSKGMDELHLLILVSNRNGFAST